MNSPAANPVSSSQTSLPDSLFAEERYRISTRLGAGLVGLGLLGLGTLLLRLEPIQWQIGEMFRALSTLVVSIPTVLSGIRGILTGDTRRATDQLVAIAILAAAATGAFATATLIPLFLEFGRLFEERSSLGARAAIDGIRSLAARQATRWRNGKEERVDPENLSAGDEIIVRPGESIAADGTVLEGRAAVDQSVLTGESLHAEVQTGSPVFAGTIALDGLLKIQVRGSGSDTVLGRVVNLLLEVERTSVPILRLFERRAGVWLPLVLTVAATTLFFTRDLSRAITVLVVATPTALVVAGPATIVAAMTVATRLRILIKSADFLERGSDVDTLILDKTGTVTVGTPVVTHLIPVEGVSEELLLKIAASCGFGSLHPLSRAVVEQALKRGIVGAQPKDLKEHPGLGVTAIVDGGRAALGRRSFLKDLGIDVNSIRDEDVSQVWVAHEEKYLGRIFFRDQPRSEAKEALASMRALGIDRLILLTGDKSSIAHEVGDALGMDDVIAEVLPAQKLEVVRREQSAGRTVMMVGDGVNDAPALAGADVGVAIGAELNEVAVGGADVALLGTDLRRLPKLVGLADVTRGIMNQNVWLAFGLSMILIVLAAAGILHPLTGALAQSIAVLVVVVNSARIMRFEKDQSGPPDTEPVSSVPLPEPS